MRSDLIAGAWIALALALAPAASADDDSEAFDRAGFYLGAGGVFVTDAFEHDIEKFIEDNAGVPVSIHVDPTWGVDARLGYRWGGWFATELEYEYVDELKVDASSMGISLGGADLRAHSATLNARLILPLWRIQPYALVGAGATQWELDDRTPGSLLGGSHHELGFAGRAGGGIDFHLTRHLVLNSQASVLLTTQDFEAPVAGDDLDDLFYVSATVGLQYHF